MNSVTIDATSLLLRSGGVKSYTWYWLQALKSAKAFPFINELKPLDHSRSILSTAETIPRIAALHTANYIPGALDLMLGDAAIFHTSNQVRRRPRRARSTATIHDLTTWTLPDLHTAGNIRADRDFGNAILRRADGLIAVSENTRQDAIRLLGIAPDRIRCIYSGVAPEFFRAWPKQVSKPYALCVGTIEPRKNIDRLLDAWLELPGDVRDEFDLVIAGPYGWGAEGTLARLTSAPLGVRHLGYIPESAVAPLTAGATTLAYPSLYEGFGFPVAQAMAAGVAVVTSNNSCLPEVAGEGALYVDALSVASIRDELLKVLTSPSLRNHLGQAGRARAGRYTWERCAEQSLRFFEDVAGS